MKQSILTILAALLLAVSWSVCAENIQFQHQYSFKNPVVVIDGFITAKSAYKTMDEINALLEKRVPAISILIISVGGNAGAGMALNDFISRAKEHVYIETIAGNVQSAAIYPFLAADHRVSLQTPDKQFFCHAARLKNKTIEDDRLNQRDRRELNTTMESTAAVVDEATHQGITADRWKAIFSGNEKEFYLNSDEAIELGIATDIQMEEANPKEGEVVFRISVVEKSGRVIVNSQIQLP